MRPLLFLIPLLRSCAVPSLLFLLCFFPRFAFAMSTHRKAAAEAALSPNSATPCRCAAEETFDPGLTAGVFKSPGFPRRYCNNLNCRWTIMPAEHSFVGAVLDFFETEHRFDVLEVYQTWWNGSSTLLSAKQAVLYGTFDPRTMERQFFSSIGGGLKFRFVSDATESDYHGFQMRFRRYSADDRGNSPCPVPFHHASANIQLLPLISPAFHIDSSCIFTIDSTSAVNLTITRFRSASLSLKVFETENFQVHSSLRKPLEKCDIWPHMCKGEGIVPGISALLPITTISRTNSLTVLLSTIQTPFSGRSAAMPSADENAIYELQFSEAQSPCACPPSQLVVGRVRPVFVASPGSPEEYCDLANCTTTLTLEGPSPTDTGAAEEEGLRVRVNAFQTEPDMDYVAVWEEDGRQKIVLSNAAMEIRHLTFDRPRFAFSFITDHSIVDSGFNFSIEAYRKQRECVCPSFPHTLLEGRAHYEENRFDRQKCQFMDCVWYINAPKWSSSDVYHRIVLKINHTIGDSSDFVLVAQGSPTERNPFRRKLNSLSAYAEVTMEFEGVEPITLWLHREAQTEDDGQRRRRRTEWNDDRRPVELNFSYEWREGCLCGANEFKADAAKWLPLRSPDFPFSYCRDMRCQWNLIAPEGFHVVLNITSFATEADQDFLYIFEGNDTEQKHKEMLSGPHFGSTVVHSEQHAVSLLFVSDGSIQADGFELWYRAEANEPGGGTGGGGHSSKALVFLLFLILAFVGATFLFTRPHQRIGTWHGFMAENPLLPAWVVRLFLRRRTNPSFSTAASFANISSDIH